MRQVQFSTVFVVIVSYLLAFNFTAKKMVSVELMFHISLSYQVLPEVALQRCSYKKLFWKYAADLQQNTHTEEWFQ